jgi:hypothetical protein
MLRPATFSGVALRLRLPDARQHLASRRRVVGLSPQSTARGVGRRARGLAIAAYPGWRLNRGKGSACAPDGAEIPAREGPASSAARPLSSSQSDRSSYPPGSVSPSQTPTFTRSARRPVPVLLAASFLDDSHRPSHFIPPNPGKSRLKWLGEWFANACVIRQPVRNRRVLRAKIVRASGTRRIGLTGMRI